MAKRGRKIGKKIVDCDNEKKLLAVRFKSKNLFLLKFICSHFKRSQGDFLESLFEEWQQTSEGKAIIKVYCEDE